MFGLFPSFGNFEEYCYGDGCTNISLSPCFQFFFFFLSNEAILHGEMVLFSICLLNNNHPNRREVISHDDFDLHWE